MDVIQIVLIAIAICVGAVVAFWGLLWVARFLAVVITVIWGLLPFIIFVLIGIRLWHDGRDNFAVIVGLIGIVLTFLWYWLGIARWVSGLIDSLD